MNEKSALFRLSTLFPINREFITFVIVGIINTLFGYAIFALFISLGLHYTLASFLGTAISLIFSFTTMGKIVFKHHHHNLFIRYLLTNTITYLLGILIIFIGSHFSDNLYLLGAISLPPMAIFTYWFNKYFVFQTDAI